MLTLYVANPTHEYTLTASERAIEEVDEPFCRDGLAEQYGISRISADSPKQNGSSYPLTLFPFPCSLFPFPFSFRCVLVFLVILDFGAFGAFGALRWSSFMVDSWRYP